MTKEDTTDMFIARLQSSYNQQHANFNLLILNVPIFRNDNNACQKKQPLR